MQINTRAVKAVFELHGFGEIGVVRAADDFICHENCSQVDTGTKIGAHTRFFTIAASSGRKMSRTAALFPFSMILVSDWTFFFFSVVVEAVILFLLRLLVDSWHSSLHAWLTNGSKKQSENTEITSASVHGRQMKLYCKLVLVLLSSWAAGSVDVFYWSQQKPV